MGSRRGYYVALLLLPALAAAGCSAPPPVTTTASRSLRIAISGDEGSLQPYTYVTGYPGWNMLTLVYDTLFVLDEENVPRPWLATGDTVSAGGLRHTLQVRADARWHDGRPLTSDDVRFSIEYYQRHPHGRWTSAVRPVARVEAPDAQTVVLDLSEPYPGVAMRLFADVPIIPRHVFEHAADPRAVATTTGSGPFRLVEHQPDRLYRLVATRDHFGGAAAIDELVIPIITEPTTGFAALEAGDVHATTRELPPELLPRFSGRSDVAIARGPGFATTLLQFNTERRPWSDARVRRAVALAIDTTRLVDTVLLGQGVPGHPGWLHPRLPGHDASLRPEFDVAAARTLLDAAGLVDGDADGIREFDGRALRPELLVQANQPNRLRAAELIASAVKAIGIDARVRAEDTTSVTARVWPDFDVSRGRSFDWAMFGWSAPVMIDPLRMTALVESDVRYGTNNIGGFRHADADRLSAALRRTTDPAEQARLLHALDAVVARERPFVVLWYADLAFAYRPAAFDGWRFQAGQGLFHKRSFLAPSTR